MAEEQQRSTARAGLRQARSTRKFAESKNTGGRPAGSITAAQFLQRFVADKTPWAHLDIAGTGMGSPQTDINKSWGSGFACTPAGPACRRQLRELNCRVVRKRADAGDRLP